MDKEISKSDPPKDDLKPKTKIPPMPKTNSKTSPSIERSNSKIPKRDLCLAKKLTRARPLKPMADKKPSLSTMSLNLPKSSLTSSRSCLHSHRSDKSRDQTPRAPLDHQDKLTEIKKKAEKVACKRNLQSFEVAKEKLQSAQDIFLNKYKLVKDDLPKEERDIKLVCLFQNAEGHLMIKNHPSKIVTNFGKKTFDELKVSLKNLVQKRFEAIDALDQIAKLPKEVGDSADRDHEIFQKIKETNKKVQDEKSTFLQDLLIEIESLQFTTSLDANKEVAPNKDLDAYVQKLVEEVTDLNTRLKESQSELIKIKKNCEHKSTTLKRDLEEKIKIESKKQEEVEEFKLKAETLEKEVVKLKIINKELTEKLTKRNHELEEINHKLKSCANNNVSLEAKNKNLEAEIENMKLDFNAVLNSNKDVARDLILKYTEEINAIKKEMEMNKKEKEIFEKEVQSFKTETVKLKIIESKNLNLENEIHQASIEKNNLNQTIKNLTEKLEQVQNQAAEKTNIQEEFMQLQALNNSNNEKIKNLENELTKSQFQVKKLEEKISLDSKLLKVRTELIDSLQSKEKTQKLRLQDLFVEVGEKNNNIQSIKTEILTKTEEFQNLFSTLSTKQMELSRQEHMIKLLQENNEQAQKLRVRHEAKIAKLEEEILELKETLAIYQDAVIPNNTLRRNLAIAEAYRGESVDNLGFYVEERRKKRHIDISVKKYEK